MSAVIDFYRQWPYPVVDDERLYSRIRRCMVLDRPKWVIDGKPVGCRPYRDSAGRQYKLWRHFDKWDYLGALRSLVYEHSDKPHFIRLRQREFNSRWQHVSEAEFVSDELLPDLSSVVF